MSVGLNITSPVGEPADRGAYPFVSARFAMVPALGQLGTEKAFDESGDYGETVREKTRLLGADAEKHVRYHDFPAELEAEVARRMAARLVAEWPGMFRLEGETLCAPGRVADLSGRSPFDAVCRTVMEDAVVLRRVDGRDFNAAIHLSFPNGWAPAEKIGRSFFETHVPVPGIGKLNARAGNWADLMITSPVPLRRHVWGLRYDDRLDHHPESASDAWEPQRPRVFFRFERQTILPMPDWEASLFLIRTHILPVEALDAMTRGTIAEAILSMPPEIAAYKGVPKEAAALVEFVRGKA